MIQLQNVTKRIKENTVLDNVSYTFKSGFVYGLYGQNGSGKTMLLRAISGLINLDSGSIFIDGEKLHDKIEFPPETGIVIENMELLPECSAKKNLQMLAKIKNIADEKDIIFSLERVGLDPDSDKKVKKFSLGMKQRLNIAQAIFENQKIILLDEPTNSLDYEYKNKLIKLLRMLKTKYNKTIVISSHDMDFVLKVSDNVYALNNGKIVLSGDKYDVLSNSEVYWEFKNGKFYFYKSVNDLTDNYWYGTTKILTGKKGFKSIGLDEDKIDNIVSKSNGLVSYNDIYTIICTPTKIISGGVDKSDTNIPKDFKLNYVWIIVDHGEDGIEAQVMDIDSYDTSYYVKISD